MCRAQGRAKSRVDKFVGRGAKFQNTVGGKKANDSRENEIKDKQEAEDIR